MDRAKLFERLNPLVNDIRWERLEDYLTYEKKQLIEKLCASSDIKQINKLQGEILAVTKILDLPKRRTS